MRRADPSRAGGRGGQQSANFALVLACVAAIVLVAVVARSTPSHPLTVTGVTLSAPPPGPGVSVSVTLGSPGFSSQTTSRSTPAGSSNALQILLLVVAGFAVIGVLVWWMRRPHNRVGVRFGDATGSDVALDPSEDQQRDVADAITGTLDRYLDAGSVDDAIVACWQAVEQAVVGAGFEMRPAETSTEFTERVLTSFGVGAAPLRELGDLYREARFSTHTMPETRRAEARRCLVAIRDDVAGTNISDQVR